MTLKMISIILQIEILFFSMERMQNYFFLRFIVSICKRYFLFLHSYVFDRIPADSDSYSRNDTEVMNAKVFITYNFCDILSSKANKLTLTLNRQHMKVEQVKMFAICRFLRWNRDLDCMDGGGLHPRYVKYIFGLFLFRHRFGFLKC